METVLIIDDQQIPRMILEQFVASVDPNLRGKTFDNPAAALAWVEENLIVMALVDYRLPGMDGIEFTRRLHALPGNRNVPVVMITALDDQDNLIRYQALSAGVMDFLIKPLDHQEWKLRCHNLLKLARSGHKGELAGDLTQLLFKVTESITGRNPKRLASISRHIAEQMGLPGAECDLIEQAAPLNDLGHFMVASHLMWRSSTLRREERMEVQNHTLAGFRLLQQCESPLYHRAAKIALSHHEQFDGKGYPHGFGGKDILLEARIVAVADFVDALLSDRPYRKAWTVPKVLDSLKSVRGKRFDPDCVDAFFERLNTLPLTQVEATSR